VETGVDDLGEKWNLAGKRKGGKVNRRSFDKRAVQRFGGRKVDRCRHLKKKEAMWARWGQVNTPLGNFEEIRRAKHKSRSKAFHDGGVTGKIEARRVAPGNDLRRI